jgi:hypothetical protein
MLRRNPRVYTLHRWTQVNSNRLFPLRFQRWSAKGLTSRQFSTLPSIKFEGADRDGIYLGEAGNDRILIDRVAGGKGW